MFDRYKNIILFNKNGKAIDLQYNKTKWTGTIHIPKISIELYETETFYLLEKVKSASGDIRYVTPFLYPTLSDTKIKCEFHEFDECFSFFNIDTAQQDSAIIKEKEIFLNFQPPTMNIDYADGLIISDSQRIEALRINVSCISMEGGIFTNKILISDSDSPIIELNLYVEIEDEDERFNSILGNLGEDIDEKIEFIFKESNIDEGLPDYKLLNKKRKEFIMEHSNLTPYFSSYRGIINVIRYFGYYNIKLKEYWMNVEDGTLYYEDVVLDETNRLKVSNILRKYPYKKTSNFGLFFDINEVIPNQFNEENLPETRLTSNFTFEEIIIKLFGLYKYILERNIGGMSVIKDIIGEYTNFIKNDIVCWHDRNTKFDIDLDKEVSFIAENTNGHIEDLRPILNNYSGCMLPRDLTGENSNGYQIGTYGNCFVGWFNNMNLETPEFLDDRLIEVGFPLRLINTSFNIKWNDMSIPWSYLGDQANIDIMWGNVSNPDYYGVEWIISRNTETSNDKRKFYHRIKGNVSELSEYMVVLPYDGFYDITLILNGWNNNDIKLTKSSYIKVSLYEPDYISFFKIQEPYLQRFSTNYLTWGEMENEWGYPVYDNTDFKMSENKIQNRSLHVVNYINTDSLNIPGVGINSETWGTFSANTWKDLYYLTWDDFEYSRERLARFVISSIKENGKIFIGKDVYQIPSGTNTHDFENVCTNLLSLGDSDIDSFDYIARYLDKTPSFIDCTSLFQGHMGNKLVGSSGGCEVLIPNRNKLSTWGDLYEFTWADMTIQWEGTENMYMATGVDNLFTWDNVNIHAEAFDVPICSRIQMVVDNSHMPGKSYCKWIISNDDTGYRIEADTFTMALRFYKKGNYNVEVWIEDTNGNINKIKKRNHIRVVGSENFFANRLKNRILNNNKDVFSYLQIHENTAIEGNIIPTQQ